MFVLHPAVDSLSSAVQNDVCAETLNRLYLESRFVAFLLEMILFPFFFFPDAF